MRKEDLILINILINIWEKKNTNYFNIFNVCYYNLCFIKYYKKTSSI